MTAIQYAVYGLTVQTDHALVGLRLAQAGQSADMVVGFGGRAWPDESHRGLAWTAASLPVGLGSSVQLWTAPCDVGRCYRLRYAGEGEHLDCLLSPDGRRVQLSWSPGVTPHDAAATLVHPALGCIVRVRGVVCLHASAVTVGDRCIAIIGSPGAGKSTTAAMLAAMGQRVLSDDVVALTEGGHGFFVQPGVSRIRLHRDSAQAVHGDEAPFQPIWSQTRDGWDKGYPSATANDNGPLGPTPLAAVYFLRPRDPKRTRPQITPVAETDRLLTLARNTFGSYMLDRAGRAHEFAVLGRLAAAVPVRHVQQPDGLDLLRDTCEAILQDLQNVPIPSASTG